VLLRVEPTETVEALPVEAGVTLVEEDDVAFSLNLCREVHRLYGEYLTSGLPATESLKAGLMMTVEMLAILSNSVQAGMPAMRITVAAAQVTELLAVIFDEDWTQAPMRSTLRARYRSMMAETLDASVPALPAPAGSQPRRGGLSRIWRKGRD
jgi:hypothetical protein